MAPLVRVTALALCLVTLSGCFGAFALTRAAHQANNEMVENRWGKQLMFYGMLFFPIYPVSLLFDLIIINPLESATGENPISGEPRTGSKVTPTSP
jgi:hypothetical protein